MIILVGNMIPSMAGDYNYVIMCDELGYDTNE